MAWPDIGLRTMSVVFPSDAAVMVFFVLSGHVLWGSFQRKEPRFFAGLPNYASARLYRLYPLAIASALPLGLIVAAPASDLVRNMLLLSYSLNGVLWSLQVEVVASFLLFAVWGLTRGSAWKLTLALTASIAAVPFSNGYLGVFYFPAFLLGASISLLPRWLWQSGWLLAGGTAILVGTNVLLGHTSITRGFEMIGATVLVGFVANGRLAFLRSRLALFLGAISYPFYLTHVFAMAVIEPYMGALPPMPALALIAAYAVASIAVTTPLAWLLHVFIENPMMRARPQLDWPRR
jgi:peptidoglycan/LPS O-acetylase OafA/YrhL